MANQKAGGGKRPHPAVRAAQFRRRDFVVDGVEHGAHAHERHAVRRGFETQHRALHIDRDRAALFLGNTLGRAVGQYPAGGKYRAGGEAQAGSAQRVLGRAHLLRLERQYVVGAGAFLAAQHQPIGKHQVAWPKPFGKRASHASGDNQLRARKGLKRAASGLPSARRSHPGGDQHELGSVQPAAQTA